MTPYYADESCRIYHGDCRVVLPMLDRVDLVLADPPYGIPVWSASGGNSLTQAEVDEVTAWDRAIDADLMQQVLAAGRYTILWGANYYLHLLGPTRAPLIWDKSDQRGMHYADGEFAWTNFDFGTLRIFGYPVKSSDVKGSQRLHPTQKPEALMLWCLTRIYAAQTVLDPFMGSGTTLVAAKRLGRQAVGIELSEKYCEIAATRLRQGSLFEPTAAIYQPMSRSLWESGDDPA